MKHKKAYEVGAGVVRFVVGVLAIGMLAASAAAQAKVNVTGTWTFQVETSGGSGSPTITLKQDGETLTGTYEGQLGKAPLKGTVKGQAISFNFTVDVQGQTADVVYEGTATDTSMKGTVNIGGGAASGTFTATKK